MRRFHALIIVSGIVGPALFAAGWAQAQSSSSVSSSTEMNVSTTLTTNADVSLAGAVTVVGEIAVSESSMAVVNNSQILSDNIINGSDDLGNIASVGTSVLMAASGNIGLNIAAGNLNAQDNASAIGSVGSTGVGTVSDGSSLVTQMSSNNLLTGGADTVNNQAVLQNSVLAGAQGNIGLNLVSGALNAQKNALTVSSVTGNAVLATASAVVQQHVHNNTLNYPHASFNTVTVMGDVLAGASGNIGVNIAAGTGNLQSNSMNISTGN